jgi:hypothetical protein
MKKIIKVFVIGDQNKRMEIEKKNGEKLKQENLINIPLKCPLKLKKATKTKIARYLFRNTHPPFLFRLKPHHSTS